MMKKVLILASIISLTALISGCTEGKEQLAATNEENQELMENNNFYDNEETFELELPELIIEGEIVNPGPVDYSALPVRSVIVKETLISGDSNAFVGAYRYDGYSLFDILNERYIDKANAEEFGPIIDLYLEVSNGQGEKVVVSWGEVYYPVHLHEIIIANKVMRIVPSKTNELWPLPEKGKLVIASDLLTERNISMPNRIMVRSHPGYFEVNRQLEPLYAPTFNILKDEEVMQTYEDVRTEFDQDTYHTIFYGRGRGIHSTQPFTGAMLKEVLNDHIPTTQENLRIGKFIVAAADGYRTVYTYSEVMNRNDQSEVLLVNDPDMKDGGAFRLFPAADFFSDRAVKAVTDINFINEGKQ